MVQMISNDVNCLQFEAKTRQGNSMSLTCGITRINFGAEKQDLQKNKCIDVFFNDVVAGGEKKQKSD